jgi:hypothetical protein
MCNCNSRTDVRARCCPIKDRQKFKICGERVHTAYYMMMADYELSCKQIDHRKSNKYNEKFIIKFLHHKLKIISRAEKDKIIKYYWNECDLARITGYTDDEAEPSEEEEEEDGECCNVCNIKKTINDIVCIQLKPIKVWKCFDCNYKQIVQY